MCTIERCARQSKVHNMSTENSLMFSPMILYFGPDARHTTS